MAQILKIRGEDGKLYDATVCTNKETGEKYQAAIRFCFSKKQYSTDYGNTWHDSAKKARLAA